MVRIVMSPHTLSRRSFVALAAAASIAAAKAKKLPIGLELYSVRDQLSKDLPGTVTKVAKMGYDCVEFYSPYMKWSTEQAKDVRKLMDDLGIKCYSTHNGPDSFTGDGAKKAMELNSIIGSKYIVMASAGRVEGLDGWKGVADKLATGAATFKSAGLRAGYHNHAAEFKPIDGKRPMEVIAAGTPKEVMLQLDLGTCVEVGSDPVAWINEHPGRINSMHCKEWSPDTGYKTLFGEGKVPWKEVFAAAEKKGGVEFYLVEQEGSRFDPFETAEKCLTSFKKAHV